MKTERQERQELVGWEPWQKDPFERSKTDVALRYGPPRDLTDPGTTTWTQDQYRAYYGLV